MLLIPCTRYKSHNGFHDELAWGCLWIGKATKQPHWIVKAREHMKYFNKKIPITYLNWDDKRAAVHTLLATMSKSKKDWQRGQFSKDYNL